MINVICDVCKKHIPEASTAFSWEKRESNYNLILDKAICYECRLQMDEELKDIMGESAEYGFLDYTQALREALDRLTQ